ncbi:ATPase [Thalassobacillus devorans]|uniref:histidine kinase n=1 Tax=Thalassobacillus devorans TaxID=279813 RepID=A0ABQ1PMK6_9BACI|nr:sensor histidine kinase [Thalassobacillus devorans]NIK30257.1 CitB family two-component system sensor histidine kinase CitS [Thalassobacillus devorans]GGC99646.1 ATPase [Thalassobacillus devorans]
MTSRFHVSLQTKILGLVITLIVSIIIILSGVFAYWEKQETEEKMGQLALQAATTLSFMPTIKEAFNRDDPAEIIQPIALSVQKEIGAEFVVIGNQDSFRYAHPDPWKIGKQMVGGDNDRALKNGEYYISKAEGTLGPSLRGKAPILDDDGDIIGIVSVGFLIDDINSAALQKFMDIGGISIAVLLLGTFGSFMLARSIRKDTMGLEPFQIASLYRDREAVLSSVKEGIIAIDHQGLVTMINQSAKAMLNIEEDTNKKPIEDILPNTQMLRVLESGMPEHNEEMILKDRVIIVNRTPILENDNVVGVVASFRDKTEVREMVNALSEVKRYSEDLRAQTHEFTNKMYVLLGLLQLGNYQEAVDLIESEFQTSQNQNRILFDQIQDDTVQAILLGKISKASEQKVEFSIDSESSLQLIPKHINRSKLVTILGNIIDNAFEAVSSQEEKKVSFFATDLGSDIVFEITDNGPGISDSIMPYLFMRGFSTKKGQNRGFGLANVNEIVEELGGTMEISQTSSEGAMFSIFIPKKGGGFND